MKEINEAIKDTVIEMENVDVTAVESAISGSGILGKAAGITGGVLLAGGAMFGIAKVTKLGNKLEKMRIKNLEKKGYVVTMVDPDMETKHDCECKNCDCESSVEE